MTEAIRADEGGPGLQAAKGIDLVLATALVAAAACLVPSGTIRLGDFHAFGPLDFAAILAIVAVLFGFLAVLRSTELEDVQMRALGVVAVVAGLLRLFLYPILGW